MKAFTTGPFTGKHFTVIMVAFFAVVIGVNLLMARAASSTFGGVVVENSYVASQEFNTWLAEARKEKALGWSAQATRLPDGRVSVVLTPVTAVCTWSMAWFVRSLSVCSSRSVMMSITGRSAQAGRALNRVAPTAMPSAVLARRLSLRHSSGQFPKANCAPTSKIRRNARW